MMLPTYEILHVHPDSSSHLLADAEGIEAARLAVATLLAEGEAIELEIVLDGRMVEVGSIDADGYVDWLVVGRSRDLR